MTARLMRIARTVLAALPPAAVDKLAERYHVDSATVHDISSRLLADNIPHPDTVTEWVLMQINPINPTHRIRWIEDLPRVSRAVRFFFALNRDPRFAPAVRATLTFIQPKNIKNLFAYNLHDLETVEEEFDKTPANKTEQERMLKIGNLPVGAKLVYNKNGWQMVKVTAASAACELSRGSKWCTSDRETAEDYLSLDPIYVIYQNGRKIAQMHLGSKTDPDLQLMDLRDRPISYLQPPFKDFLKDTGLLLKAAWRYFLNSEWISFDPIYNSDDEIKKLIEKQAALEPWTALQYAQFVTGEPFPAGEPAIATNSYYSYRYAEDVLHGPFPAGESMIATNSYYSYRYAEDVLHGPFPAGEPAIARRAGLSANYASGVLGGRFLLGEPEILKDPSAFIQYMEEVIDGRWLDAEPVIAKDAYLSVSYAIALRERFVPGEPMIAKYPHSALTYAIKVLKDRFPLAEPAIIAEGDRVLTNYRTFLRSIGKLDEFSRDWGGKALGMP